MVTTEPLIGARIPDQSDGPLGGLQIANAVRDLISYTVPRLASVAARNTAYAAWVAAGGTLADGMCCSTAAEGIIWHRLGGEWVALATDTPPGRRVQKTGTQASATAWTLITWENLSTSTAGPGMWASANPSRLVATRPGRYRLLVGMFGVYGVMVRKNAGGNAGAGEMVASDVREAVAGQFVSCPGDEIPMGVGDYVEAFGIAATAGTMGAGTYTVSFSLTRIGEL